MTEAALKEPGSAVDVAVAVAPRSTGARVAATPKMILEVVLGLMSKGVPSFAGTVDGTLQWFEGMNSRDAGKGNQLMRQGSSGEETDPTYLCPKGGEALRLRRPVVIGR
ncbi:hypothetical protein ACFY84_32505 [Streptomyces sp. NPDC012438]|uniref:hypothetical protein n=1 Tax=Streptomyces sp. NPDC012438 TaxID=3364833 RepID=UPI0036EE98A3